MTRADEVERAAFNKWWSGMAHPMNEMSPKPITRSAFSAGYRAALPSPTGGGACPTCGSPWPEIMNDECRHKTAPDYFHTPSKEAPRG